MSAYIVEESHIKFLVDSFAQLAPRRHAESNRWNHLAGTVWTRYEINEGSDIRRIGCQGHTAVTPQWIGQMLWNENHKSIAYRYDESDDAEVFHHPDIVKTKLEFTGAELAQVVESIRCYAYQTCEHSDWPTSNAHSFCEGLTASVLRRFTRAWDQDTIWGAPLAA